MRGGLRALLTCFGAFMMGCGGAVTQFEPAHSSGSVSAMYPVTSYDLKIGGSFIGDAIVWSEGAEDVSPEEQVLDVEIAIRNVSHAPLRVDVSSALSLTLRDGRTESLGSPQRVVGSRTVQPDSSGRVGLRYRLRAGLAAHDLRGFEFNWRVESHVGDYAQSTAFVALAPKGADALLQRDQPCGAVYRIRDPHECVALPFDFPVMNPEDL